MGHLILNILLSLLMFGVLGYLLTTQIIDVGFMYEPGWMVLGHGVIGEFVEYIICI